MKTPVLFFASAAFVFAQTSGQGLYTTHCAVCHGAVAEGGSGPDLTSSRWHASVSDAELDGVISNGKPGTAMPAFAQLDRASRGALIAHLRALASQGLQPTTNVQAPVISVSPERLLAAAGDNENWLTYSRDYGNQRFSPLRSINQQNVRNLAPVWSFQTGTPDGLQSTPLLVNGVLYLSTSWNHVFAIDARTGTELWHYRRKLPEKLKYCCGPVNRGVAVLNDSIYLATLDAHLVALDARTGRPKWDVEMGKVEQNLSGTAPPLAVGDKVFIGIAGGDFPSRAFIDAYDARSG
jgi:glucose dehydrogenase